MSAPPPLRTPGTSLGLLTRAMPDPDRWRLGEPAALAPAPRAAMVVHVYELGDYERTIARLVAPWPLRTAAVLHG